MAKQTWLIIAAEVLGWVGIAWGAWGIAVPDQSRLVGAGLLGIGVLLVAAGRMLGRLEDNGRKLDHLLDANDRRPGREAEASGRPGFAPVDSGA